MNEAQVRIGVVAPGGRLTPEAADRVQAFAASLYPRERLELVFHPQCFLSDGHFAGPDAARAEAFLEIANDEGFDALWVGRGGYGACRILAEVLPRLNEAAREKAYLGYSDAGNLLAPLYGRGFAHVAHGPLAADILREGGEAAVRRALTWLVERDPRALEPSVSAEKPAVAFNMAILSHLLGTPYLPPLDGHVLMLEEVSEHMYRIDRFMFQIASSPAIGRVTGIRLGRCSAIPPNEPEFGRDEEAVVRDWCGRSGIAYLGRADIGHDADNKVVPFGRTPG
jgi:muramoyltetrapeptide carboxypeptidase